MGRRAKSKTKERQIYVEISERWKARAAELYNQELEKESGETKKGLRKICEQVEEECWKAEKVRIKISKTSFVTINTLYVPMRRYPVCFSLLLYYDATLPMLDCQYGHHHSITAT